ncbi:TPA: galactokinase [Candidatus Latescibacteria bacterium]|nr:galactokinase [Candidatus Latescibacterota bacterium]
MSDRTDTSIILVGGQGTRLRPAVSGVAKPMAEVLGRPFLAYLFDQLLEADLRQVVLSTGYAADSVEDHFGASYGGLRLTYSREREPLGTAGAVRLAWTHLEASSALVLNGDSYVDVDLGHFLTWSTGQVVDATLVSAKVDDLSRYGALKLSADGLVQGFEEKRADSGKRSGWINAGVYHLRSSVVDTIPKLGPSSLERDVFPKLVPGQMAALKRETGFIDIGTPESYREAEEFFAERGRVDGVA